ALKKLEHIYHNKEAKRTAVMAFLFVMLIISAYTTSIIGIHSLFGAFMAGVVMPPSFDFRKIVTDKIEDISIVLLLPLFFVITGLRTQIGLLNDGHLWVTFGWILLVALAGKFGGSALAAKIVGQSWKDSLSIGILMNTRGLMQLIVLNIGYDLGVLTPEMFAMMVLMALVTTFMTGPALDLINKLIPEEKHAG
ncbi:MAG TPA: cation:proton antiporter, partial [Ferruginibacter sp.]|nr:cation:proton antiporter [Ferruginibacter sp.]